MISGLSWSSAAVLCHCHEWEQQDLHIPVLSTKRVRICQWPLSLQLKFSTSGPCLWMLGCWSTGFPDLLLVVKCAAYVYMTRAQVQVAHPDIIIIYYVYNHLPAAIKNGSHETVFLRQHAIGVITIIRKRGCLFRRFCKSRTGMVFFQLLIFVATAAGSSKSWAFMSEVRQEVHVATADSIAKCSLLYPTVSITNMILWRAMSYSSIFPDLLWCLIGKVRIASQYIRKCKAVRNAQYICNWALHLKSTTPSSAVVKMLSSQEGLNWLTW